MMSSATGEWQVMAEMRHERSADADGGCVSRVRRAAAGQCQLGAGVGRAGDGERDMVIGGGSGDDGWPGLGPKGWEHQRRHRRSTANQVRRGSRSVDQVTAVTKAVMVPAIGWPVGRNWPRKTTTRNWEGHRQQSRQRQWSGPAAIGQS